MAIVGVQKSAGDEEGFHNYSKRWPCGAKMGPRWAKMQPRHEKMSPRSVARAGRLAVFAKLGQFRGKEGPRMYF